MLNTYLYRSGKPLEAGISRAQMLAALSDKEALLWVDIEAPSDFEEDCLVEIFNFHPLAIEDCINDLSQPKVDDYEDYLFLVVHAVDVRSKDAFASVELDIFLGRNFVVTFHKEAVRSIAHVREWAAKKPEAWMGQGPDLLVHAVLDQLVDGYSPVLHQLDERIDLLEDEILHESTRDFVSNAIQIKKDLFSLRRIIAPQRDTINYLTRNPSAIINPKNTIYFRDIYDHLFRIYGEVEGFHEMVASILQVYFSQSSHRLNEIVKRMTVMATLTMPSVIIASIYGMNFKFMPELEWYWGYPLSIGLMALIGLVMLAWMKWRKWI